MSPLRASPSVCPPLLEMMTSEWSLAIPDSTSQPGASEGSKELNQTLLPNHFQLERKGSDGLEQPGEVEAILSFLQGSRVSKLPSLLCELPGPHK